MLQRFAYFSLIPLFILQLLLLGLGTWALFARRPQRSGHRELEKAGGRDGQYPLTNVPAGRQNPSFDTKSESSPQSYQGARVFAGKS